MSKISKAGNRLSVKKIEKLQKAGRYPDGHGLYLQVTDTGKKSWLFRYERDNKST